MHFDTDNLAGASPEIVAAVARAAGEEMAAYGADRITQGLAARFSELFGREVEVYPTVSGTAANALSLALVSAPYTAIYCHENAHVLTGEMGSVEFYSQGARLVGLAGSGGRMDPAVLEDRLERASLQPSQPPASAVTVTQLSEAGTLYRADQLREIGRICRARGLRLHMDGARFAMAVAALGVTPAQASVELGVDILSFGGTKNGTMMADCIVVFASGLGDELKARRKRAGLTLAKMRFVSAQLDAYLADDLWLRNASKANAAMKRLVSAIGSLPGVSLQFPPEANEAFLILDRKHAGALREDGVRFRLRGVTPEGGHVFRLVTSFATTDAQIDALSRKFEKAGQRAFR